MGFNSGFKGLTVFPKCVLYSFWKSVPLRLRGTEPSRSTWFTFGGICYKFVVFFTDIQGLILWLPFLQYKNLVIGQTTNALTLNKCDELCWHFSQSQLEVAISSGTESLRAITCFWGATFLRCFWTRCYFWRTSGYCSLFPNLEINMIMKI